MRVRLNVIGIVGVIVCVAGMAIFFIVSIPAGLAVLAVGLAATVFGLVAPARTGDDDTD